MMSYWNCVIKARAPTLLLWGTLQAAILYTIYDQKRHARTACLGDNRFAWRSHIPATHWQLDANTFQSLPHHPHVG